ncbi:MAG TPA: alkaline phosphatase family protein, partial [Terracidiphilus sp.]
MQEDKGSPVRAFLSALFAMFLASTSAFATVTVSSPTPNSTVTSPVHYVATASTTTCSTGVASMGIYVNNQLVYTVNGASLNTNITMANGNQHTVVEEWDKCGGASYTTVNIVVGTAPTSTKVTVSSPTSGSTVTSPVHYVATAQTATCAGGVSSMGIYVANKLMYTVNGASLNTNIAMATGAEHTVVEEWDYCGGAAYTAVDLNVTSGTTQPTVSIAAQNSTISSGSSDVLTVNATNATGVVVTGSDGSSYTLSSTGGAVTVKPTSTTTYTAEASNASKTVSAQTTVTVTAAANNPINHVVFMLQENHSFDNYFGMLNPYRHVNGWDIGSDGKTYTIDGIDDKLNKISNQDDEGTSYPLFKLRSTCIDDDSSAWLESYGDVNRWDFSSSRKINMDGFVHIAEGFAKSCNTSGTCSGKFTDTTGERAMGYYDQDFLNWYYYMAAQFGVSDRWFSPVASKSIPNRIATFSGGTTQGLVFDPGGNDHLPQLSINNIFQELQGGGVSWKLYYTVTQGGCKGGSACGTGAGNLPASTFLTFTYSTNFLYANSAHAACTGTTKPSSVWGDTSNFYCVDPNHIAPLSQYYTDLKNNTLPAFAFIESGSGLDDEHPGSGQSVLTGQSEVATVVNSLMTSPSWSTSAFFLAYDEGGGPYDHVPPVSGHSNDFTDSSLGTIPDISSISVNPDSYNPCLPTGSTPTTHCDLLPADPGAHSTDAAKLYGFRAQLGFRVPNMVISPYVRKHYVSHVPMDHTA